MKPAELGKSGAIDKYAISHAWDVLKKAEPKSERDVAVWMGKHATAKRFGESIALFDEKGFLEQLGANKKEIDYDAWEEAGFLQRNECVRFAFIDSVNDNSMDIDDDGLLFFAGGISWTMKTDEGKAIAYTLANDGELEFVGKPLKEKENASCALVMMRNTFVLFYTSEIPGDRHNPAEPGSRGCKLGDETIRARGALSLVFFFASRFRSMMIKTWKGVRDLRRSP